MTMYPAGEITGKDDTAYPIFVDNTGYWHATVGDNDLREPVRDRLRKEIEKHTKRRVVKVSVPFTQVTQQPRDDGRPMHVVQGVATGLHAANGNVLATYVRNGTEVREQITDRYTSRMEGVYFKPLAPEEAASLQQLWINRLAAEKAYRAFINMYGIDLRSAVLKAIDEKE